MRLKCSDTVQELHRKVAPYIVFEGSHPKISDDAPEGIEELFKEYLELSDKEYMHAFYVACGFSQPTE